MPAPSVTSDITIAVAEIGARAADTLAALEGAIVTAVFARSFHLTLPGERILCIVSHELGPGPLTLRCAPTSAISWDELGVAPGVAVTAAPGLLRVSGVLTLDLATAKVWQPSPWPPLPSPEALTAALAEARRLAGPIVPEGSIAGLLVSPRTAPSAGAVERATLRAAGLKIATLADWLAVALRGGCDLDQAAAAAVRGLLGLGAGLTPAGDDLLSGLMIALHAAGAPRLARHVAAAIAQAPAHATTPLARAFLACAASGEPAAPLHHTLCAILTGDKRAMADAIAALEQTGASSGFDMLAGALLVLDAIADGEPSPR